jgi:hypothetical protein
MAYCTHDSRTLQPELGPEASSGLFTSNFYSKHTVSKQRVIPRIPLTVHEVTIVVGDALAQVEVTALAVTFGIKEVGAEDRYITVSLKSEVDVLCCLAEVLAVPGEVACIDQSQSSVALV